MMNLFTLMTAMAETTAETANETAATGAPASRLFTIITLILVCLVVVAVGIYLIGQKVKTTRTTADEYLEDAKRMKDEGGDEAGFDNFDDFDENDDLSAELASLDPAETATDAVNPTATPIMSPAATPTIENFNKEEDLMNAVNKDIAEILFGGEDSTNESTMSSEAAEEAVVNYDNACIGQIPANAKIKTEAGSFTFYDYHKTQKGKLLVIPENGAGFEVISMEDVIQITSKELTTVRLINGFLILSGNDVNYVDSLLAASKLSAKASVPSDVKLETIPEGQLLVSNTEYSKNTTTLGVCLKELHYHGGNPSIWYMDNDGNPGAMGLSKITSAKIVSSTETLSLERVRGSDMLVIIGVNSLKLVNAITGRIVAI